MTQSQQPRRASIKETGEELSQEEWQRFDAAVAELRARRSVQHGSTFDGYSIEVEQIDVEQTSGAR